MKILFHGNETSALLPLMLFKNHMKGFLPSSLSTISEGLQKELVGKEHDFIN